jgi:hypothetical protein
MQVLTRRKISRFQVGLGTSVLGMLAVVASPANAAGITASADGEFKNSRFAMTQTSQFTAEFDATPTNTDNAGVGFSDDATQSYADTATFVRFNSSGNIDARNGSAFAAAAAIPYHSGSTYHFREDVDVVNHVYSIAVKVPGKTPNPYTVVGTNFAFRTTANAGFALDNLVVRVKSTHGTLNVDNLVVTALAPQVPIPDCTIIIPPNPLTAAGLATPYRLKSSDHDDGPCNQANAAQSAFVQAAIINTDTGQISIYAPLVIDDGTTPAVPPVVPDLPHHYVAALWFGFNGTNLKQAETAPGTLLFNNCVNGFFGSLFSQFSYCNAPAFFAAANKAIANKQLVVPAPGTGSDGQPCPTVRSFAVVDQDQSDNVPTTYLVTTTGQFAQNTAINRAALAGSKVFANPSDNRLVTALLDPALGCTPWTAPDLTDALTPAAALALNELQAAAFQAAPVALVPLNDPMTTINGDASLGKVDAYRIGVDQPLAFSVGDASGKTYCANFRAIHPTKLALDKTLLAARPSPFPDMANSLFTFLAMRESASYTILGCQELLGKPDRVTPILNGAGVVIDATIH